MKVFSRLRPACLAVLLAELPAVSAQPTEPPYSILHTFHGEESNPSAPLTSDGHGNLYGTTISGGGSDYGTVFTVRTDGQGFQRLHTFTGGGSDGFWPLGSLIFDGFGNLYGTTLGGGPANAGTVFTVRVDGGGFRLLHSFTGGAGDGDSPFGSPALDDAGNLYGTTIFGGQAPTFNPFGDINDGRGTIFRMKTDGSAYQLLRSFQDDPNDGADPSGSLITDGSGSLYGMTVDGGASNGGIVFRIRMDGSGFQILHSFTGGATDGNEPVGSLVLGGTGTLFGVTQGSGFAGLQMIFKLRTDGTGYQVLRAFVDLNDGYSPSGSLTLDGSETLYGAMSSGGSSSAGTIFSINTDGSLFHVVYTFEGFLNDGSLPMASLISDGLGYIYGTTFQGGSANAGTVFRIKSDGTGFQILYAFGVDWSFGGSPRAPLVLDHAGNLYGMTSAGGPSNLGTIFKMRTDGTGFQVLHGFLGGDRDGLQPTGALILDGVDNLYGTTPYGGPADAGTVFRMRTDGTGFQLLHTFSVDSTSDGGSFPTGSLILDGSGNLYGMAGNGGSGGSGTAFTVRTDGTGFKVLHAFAGPPDDGMLPTGALRMDAAANLFGATLFGGSSYDGTVFKMRADGTNFQLLHSFVDSAVYGGNPNASLSLDGFGNIYGTTNNGGPSDVGTVFTVRTDGTGFQILHAFGSEPNDGQEPVSSLLLEGSGTLIGTTGYGGAGGFGTVFALSARRPHAIATPGPFVPVRKR